MLFFFISSFKSFSIRVLNWGVLLWTYPKGTWPRLKE
jgi:hypothetical protein